MSADRKPGPGGKLSGSKLSGGRLIVRPARGQERVRWDELARAHGAPWAGDIDRARLRHVATIDGTWLALIGWQAAAAPVGARDRWIGWPDFLRMRRQHLIAENTQLIALAAHDGDPGATTALAARAMRRSLDRLREDWRRAHGHPVLLAESRGWPTQLRERCYAATKWEKPEAKPPDHGRAVWIRPLASRVGRILCTPDEPRDWKCPVRRIRPLKKTLPSLSAGFRALPHPGTGRNGLFPPVYLYSVVFLARLSGLRGSPAIADYATGLTQSQRRDLGARPTLDAAGMRIYPTPSPAAVQRFLRCVDQKSFDKAGRAWIVAGRSAGIRALETTRPAPDR